MPDRPPCDRDIRERVTSDLRTTFLLEAGAGTGKTRVLVDRFVRCVLDPGLGTGDVRTVAAVTFTEKAAGELRQRIREELELRIAAAMTGSDEAVVLRRALDELDDAPISTIHGFAARLLREIPVEAGVDPAFEQLDGLSGEIARARLWEEWLGLLAGGDGNGQDHGGDVTLSRWTAARVWLSRLLRAGVTLETVRKLAAGADGLFGERYDVDPAPPPPPEPDLHARLGGLVAPLDELARFCEAACSDASDAGCSTAIELVEAVRRLVDQPPDGLDELAGALAGLPLKTGTEAPGGRAEKWDAAQGGKAGLQSRYQTLAAEVADLREDYAAYLAGLAIAVADTFARWAGAAQIALGRLDFTDLLGRLRDVLAHDRGARRVLQQRFRFLLVDEFQDTDPLQAEIVLYLCEHEPRAGDWREVVLEPGKLFLVGDPKQSIYRFRRADITLYDQVKRLVLEQPGSSGAAPVITQNFRTTPLVVDWVNRVFDGVFGLDAEEGRQPAYELVAPYRPAAGGPRVSVLLGRQYATHAAGERDTARRDEAHALAALLVGMHGGGSDAWHVLDREADAGSEIPRPPRWGDIALLVRQTTGLETYEQALREAGVPYRVDGGKTYFSRREVADALLCLRAADDPADGPALYGALHSCFFGFSDEDLFLFWSTGGRFDIFASGQPAGHQAIAGAMAVLRRLHEQRAACEAHELVAELVRLARGQAFLAAAGPGAPQAIANLDKLIERALAFSEAGGGGLGAFLAWAADAGDAAGEQESQVDDDADVVRVLTIHKAKGLEYPIVLVVGGALPGSGGGGGPIVNRTTRTVSVRVKADLPGAAGCELEPRAYAALRERERLMAASELRRLMYVAATRARDHLVISCFGKLETQRGDPAVNVLLAPLAGSLPPIAAEPPSSDRREGDVSVLTPRTPARGRQAEKQPDVAKLIGERRQWADAHAALLDEAARPVAAVSPSGLEQVDEPRPESDGPLVRATALCLGSAVHRVLELCDLADEDSLHDLAERAVNEVGRPELASRANELARACWRAAPVRAAVGSGRFYRELPLGALLEGTLVEGAVDLLYERDGEWVVVDYKTDTVEPDELLRRYRSQGAAYALAVEAAVGGRVHEVAFVRAAAAGAVVTVPVDDELRAWGRQLIGQEGARSVRRMS